MKKIRAIKGTYDILPGDVELWQHVERTVRDVFSLYAYHEIRTPVFEETGLFARSIGEDTDVVGKEMYTFTDKGNRSITLRPEGTAPVVRSFIEHSLDQQGLPRKLWYMGPMFRQERPQKGRQRQFHQFGAEVVGSASPMLDAEIIRVFDVMAKDLGITKRTFSVNSLGGEESTRSYRHALVNFLDSVEDRLCDDCKRRKTTNPLRVLDCKVPSCRDLYRSSDALPKPLDHLTGDDRRAFDDVLSYLALSGVTVEIDRFLVRGFDYYTGTVFEMNHPDLGSQSALMGGGRYNNLLAELGGPALPAVGFACGMERLLLAVEAETAGDLTGERGVDVFIVQPSDDLRQRAVSYAESLRAIGVTVDMDYLDRSMKAQMKAAARSNAGFALIIEQDDPVVTARNMRESQQESMPFEAFLSLMSQGK